MLIAKSGAVEISVPADAWYSFFNSPYVGHRSGTAVDVYFPEEPLFPVEEGRVVRIRKVRAPKHLPYEEDYVLVIRLNDEICLKVLHVRPGVKEGEKLEQEDPLGEMIISGFFMPWSSKHAHFEIRRCGDSIRARGALPLEFILNRRVPVSAGNEFVVEERHSHFLWLRPAKVSGVNATPITSDGKPVEGGLPHYGLGAVFGDIARVNVFGLNVNVSGKIGSAAIFKADFRILANSREVRGIGLYCNQPRVKLIGGDFEEGDTIVLRAERKSI